jgi:hypothetical protein
MAIEGIRTCVFYAHSNELWCEEEDVKAAIAKRDSRIAQLEAKLAAATKVISALKLYAVKNPIGHNGMCGAVWGSERECDCGSLELKAAIAATQANEGGEDG